MKKCEKTNGSEKNTNKNNGSIRILKKSGGGGGERNV